MPTYTLINKETQEEGTTENITWEKLQEFLSANPKYTQKLTTPGFISDSKSIHRRAGTEWQDMLKHMKKTSGKGNTIKV
jgi:hypothetical protein